MQNHTRRTVVGKFTKMVLGYRHYYIREATRGQFAGFWYNVTNTREIITYTKAIPCSYQSFKGNKDYINRAEECTDVDKCYLPTWRLRV